MSTFFTSNVYSDVNKSQVIANTSVSQSRLNVEQLRRIFSMRQSSWNNDQAITVFVLASDHETHVAFTTQMLGLFPYQLERIWNKLIYSGLGEQPIKVDNELEMMERVKRHPGAIGYVSHGTKINGFKKLTIVREQ